MLLDVISLHFFANFMKMCSSPSVGSIFSKSDFCQYPTQDDVSIPKVASKPPLLERHFRPVLCKNDIFHRLSGKWPTLEALFSITYVLACIFKQIFIFSVLILPLFLGSSVDRHFYPRLHSGSNFHISALGSVTPLEKLCLMSCACLLYTSPSPRDS